MKTKIILLVGLLFLIIATAIVIIMYNIPKSANSMSYPYSTANEALDEGIAAESADNIAPGETKGLIILQEYMGESIYVVVKIPYLESGRKKHFVFVGELKEKKGKFAFLRRSNDYGLNTTGDVDDGDYTPYNAYLINDIDGLYFEVGKIFSKDIKPTMNNQPIPLDSDQIFAVSQVGRKPDVTMTHIK